FEVLPEALDQGFPKILREVFETGEPFYGTEIPFEMSFSEEGNIEVRYFDLIYVRIDAAEGEPYGVYNHAIDVTERVTARKTFELSSKIVEESRADLKDTLESMSDAFFSVDEHWTITQVNSTMLRTAQKPASELLGKNFFDIFFPTLDDRKTSYWKDYHRAMRDRVPVSFVDHYKPFPNRAVGLRFFIPTSVRRKKQKNCLLRSGKNSNP
ncbi:MAG: PAS domain-containing protein, partial [Flavobacterium sp.]